MMQKLKGLGPKTHPTRLAATVIGVGLAVGSVALWFGWAAKERSLEPRTRDRLR